jgi:hypothetical protein
LRRRIGELEGMLAGRTVGKPGAKMPAVEASGRGVDAPPSPAPATPVSELLVGEDLYQAIKARLAKEAPALLKVLTLKPGLEVEVRRETVTVDGSTWLGRTAQLVAEGYFKTPRKVGETHQELLRRGATGIPARTSEGVKALLQKGFLTLEENGYREVPDMKVRIVEAA